MDEDLLVFDLRNGRVGGLTFCKIVETWFRPEECFELDNHTHIAAAQWAALPPERRNGMRFVWGHSFSAFQKLVALNRRCKIVGLVRHPLLKISGFHMRAVNGLSYWSPSSVHWEFHDYIKEGGVLPTSSVDEFFSAHFMLGITEFMEESLFLLRAKLKIDAPIKAWMRIGSTADQNENIYSRGLLKDFIESDQYLCEIGYYNNARDKFFGEFRASQIGESREYKAYKAICRDRDGMLSKWTSAYPHIFSQNVRTVKARAVFNRWGAARWWDRLTPRRHLTAGPTRIVPERLRWTVIIGDGEAEYAEEDASLERLDSSLFEIHVRFSKPFPTAPNMIRIDLDMPAMAYGSQSIYCSIMRHTLFDIDVGPKPGVRRFDIPISPAATDIAFVFRQFGRALRPGDSSFAVVRKLSVLHIPLEGEAP